MAGSASVARAPSPEMRLLLDACRLDERPPNPEGPLDVDRLTRLAAHHRVSGLVYERRERLPLPDAALDPLRRATLATLHRNLHLAAELKIALRALNAAGVPVMLIKGAHMMDAVYGNPALRPVSDLDLLTRPECAGQALTALEAAGYAAGASAGFHARADREIRLCKSTPHDVALDLHLDLNRPTRHHWFPMEAIWARSVPYAFEGQPARALCPVDNLIFLCTHVVPHAYGQLVWLCDIARLVRQTPLDAGGLARAARAARATRATDAGLGLARTVLGAPVEDAALGALHTHRAPDRLLTPAALFESATYTTTRSLRYRAALADSAGDAASILASAVWRKAMKRFWREA